MFWNNTRELEKWYQVKVGWNDTRELEKEKRFVIKLRSMMVFFFNTLREDDWYLRSMVIYNKRSVISIAPWSTVTMPPVTAPRTTDWAIRKSSARRPCDCSTASIPATCWCTTSPRWFSRRDGGQAQPQVLRQISPTIANDGTKQNNEIFVSRLSFIAAFPSRNYKLDLCYLLPF